VYLRNSHPTTKTKNAVSRTRQTVTGYDAGSWSIEY
jgi:hypothetical protein